MPEEPLVTVQQMKDMIDTIRRTVEAGSESARRIETLEKASMKFFDVIERLQSNQQRLLDTFEKHANLQNKLNEDLANSVTRLMAEVERLGGGGNRGLIM